MLTIDLEHGGMGWAKELFNPFTSSSSIPSLFLNNTTHFLLLCSCFDGLALLCLIWTLKALLSLSLSAVVWAE